MICSSFNNALPLKNFGRSPVVKLCELIAGQMLTQVLTNFLVFFKIQIQAMVGE